METVIHSDNDFATVAYLRIKKAHLESKTAYPTSPPLAIPPLLDEEFQSIYDSLPEAEKSSSSIPVSLDNPFPDFPTATNRNGKWVAVTNVQVQCSADESIEDEVTKCFHALQGMHFPAY